MTVTFTVWVKSLPSSLPLMRNFVVHVRVSPCGASVATVMVSSNTTSEPLITVCGKAGSKLTDRPVSQVVDAVTRLASGLPVGGDLEYADEVTLGRAFEGRTLIHA